MFHLNLPSILHDETSSPSITSGSSTSSFSFTGSELSRGSHFTDSSSIIGGDPQLPHTDSEWMFDVENAVKETAMRVLEGFDKAFLQEDTCDDLYDQTYDEFDAVGAIRARLRRNPPTITTQRALETIEKRSRPTSAWDGEDSLASKVVVVVDVAEEIEDYAGDCNLGDEEQLEVSVTPKRSGCPALRTVHDEADGGVGLSTTVIRPIDANWNCPSFDINFSAVASVSQSMVSPLLLDNPMFLSPLLFQEPIFGSPTVSVSSVLFRSRRALPNSPQDDSLNFAGVIQLEIGANPSINSDRYRGQRVGLGLVGTSTPKAPSILGFHGDQDCQPTSMEGTTHESGSVKSPEVRLHVDFREPGVCRRYIPRATLAYMGLGGNNISTDAATVTTGSDHLAALEEYINPVVGSRERRKASPKVKGLGLGLPSSLKRSEVRHSSCLPRSEGCQDLASLSMSPVVDESVRALSRRPLRLSPIPEEDWAQLLRSPLLSNHERQKKRGIRSRGIIKRALKFLF